MVSTRLQSRVISTRKYTPLSISIQDLSSSNNPSSSTRPSNRRNSTRSPTKVIKPTSPRGSSRRPAALLRPKATRDIPSLIDAELASLDASLKRSKRSVEPTIPEDMCPGNAVFPSASFGARQEVGLSKIARADRDIKLWEEILITHQQNIPELVPQVRQKLQEAKDKRAKIDDTLEENIRVGAIDPITSAIKNRLEILEWALSTSKFGPEAENIKCAIRGYRSRAIKYSTNFTILYAGHIVDTASTYESFVADRNARLDRYFALHGKGWMWYEPPLDKHPETKPKALASAPLQRNINWSGLGCYNVNQGFWKRAGFVRRMAQTDHTSAADNEANFVRDPNDPTLVDCQQDGPRLSYWSVLDSGATFPSLHDLDFLALGIDPDNYSAQCADLFQTANGQIRTRIWEMFVCVLDANGRQLVDPTNAVWPQAHLYLGGLCPVIESPIPITQDEFGMDIANRLSGMLPFVACYISCAPTRDYLFLGEDRNDVLGSHRIPGQKKWRIDLPQIIPGLPFDRYDNPKVSFYHRQGEITDIDHPTVQHRSTIKFLPGSVHETVIESNPGGREPGGGGMLGFGH